MWFLLYWLIIEAPIISFSPGMKFASVGNPLRQAGKKASLPADGVSYDTTSSAKQPRLDDSIAEYPLNSRFSNSLQDNLSYSGASGHQSNTQVKNCILKSFLSSNIYQISINDLT